MKRLYHILIAFCGMLLLASCTFEAMPFDKYNEDFVFDTRLKAEGYVLATYTGLPFSATDNNGYTRVDGAMLSSATDESCITVSGSTIIYLTEGSLTSRKTNPDGCWTNYYKYIRDLNIGLNGIDKLSGNEDLKAHLIAEMKFLKAYYNFELVKRYGGIPIMDEVVSLSDGMDIPRSSFAECIDYICNLCDEAAANLPTPQNVDFGRASSAAAYALKARALLYAASPLYNGTGYDGSTNEFICYGKTDASLWQKAAEAASKVISMGYYNIYAPEEITDAMTDEQVIEKGESNYRKLFITISGNKELILSRTSSMGNQVEKDNFPVGITNGKGLTSPSQQMVDAYGMVNGLAIDDSASGYSETSPYENRDPRFYGSIFYNGQDWKGTTIETFKGGLHNNTSTSTKTGYYLSKFCSKDVVISGTTTSAYHCFPLFRYGELLLNYAEALNEAAGPDTDLFGIGMTARDAVKAVRARVLRPSQCDVAATTQDEMRIAIRDERRVELAFEDFRYFDLKRWKTASDVLNKNIEGMAIAKNGENFVYSRTTNVAVRQFTDKFYLYPIPNGEITSNAAITKNNPLW